MDQAGSKIIKIEESNPTLTGIYTVLVKVDDHLSINKNSELTFQVTVKCTKSIDLLNDPIVDISRLMEVDPPETFTYSMPTYAINPSFCM